MNVTMPLMKSRVFPPVVAGPYTPPLPLPDTVQPDTDIVAIRVLELLKKLMVLPDAEKDAAPRIFPLPDTKQVVKVAVYVLLFDCVKVIDEPDPVKLFMSIARGAPPLMVTILGT